MPTQFVPITPETAAWLSGKRVAKKTLDRFIRSMNIWNQQEEKAPDRPALAKPDTREAEPDAPHYTIHTDASIVGNGRLDAVSGYGFVVYGPDGLIEATVSGPGSILCQVAASEKETVNTAELTAIARALQYCIDHVPAGSVVWLRSDSMLSVKLVFRRGGTIAPPLRRLADFCKKLAHDLKVRRIMVSGGWVSRDFNDRADKLADLGRGQREELVSRAGRTGDSAPAAEPSPGHHPGESSVAPVVIPLPPRSAEEERNSRVMDSALDRLPYSGRSGIMVGADLSGTPEEVAARYPGPAEEVVAGLAWSPLPDPAEPPSAPAASP